MFRRRHLTAYLLYFILVTYIFPHENQALKCRVENDEKTEDRFQDVVRACMSNNYGNGQRRHEHNSDNQSRNQWQKKNNNRGSTHYPHGDRDRDTDYHQDYEGEEDEPDYRNPYNYNRHHRHRRANSKLFFNQRNNRTNNSNQNNNKNANNNKGNLSSLEDIDACIVHCIFQQMKMLNDDDQPDKSSVTRVMTQRIRDPDLKEFIQDAVTECFEITNPDNERGKCEFSKNLALCLEQRGQQNCEDWDDKPERNKSSKPNSNSSKNSYNYPDMHRG